MYMECLEGETDEFYEWALQASMRATVEEHTGEDIADYGKHNSELVSGLCFATYCKLCQNLKHENIFKKKALEEVLPPLKRARPDDA